MKDLATKQLARIGKVYPAWTCNFDKTGKACGNTDASSFVDNCSICNKTV
jgi:hypothetical protein